jgi:hypothetical protein
MDLLKLLHIFNKNAKKFRFDNSFNYFNLTNNIGSVLIIVAFGMVAFCGVAAVVIDLSRVYMEAARVEESVESAAMAASRELAAQKTTVAPLTATQEVAVKNAAISFALQNGLTLASDEIVIAGNRVYIDGNRKIDYSFAKLIGYDSTEVTARRVVEIDRDGRPKLIKQAQYHVMPWGIPHRELVEPYDISTRQITMAPDDTYGEAEKFTPGQEYVLKLGSGVASGDPAVPLGAQILIPMGSENDVNDQWSIGFKRAYGLILWLLTSEARGGAGLENVKWLLNYRGGSFMFPYNPALLTRLGALKLSGGGLFGSHGMFTTLNDFDTGRQLFPYVKYWIVEDPTSIMSQTTAVINLTTAPRIGVYSSGEDAVTRTLIDAGIPYDNFYDAEILAGILTTPLTEPDIPYTWLHLHHENFYGGSASQTPVPMISIRDTSGNDQTGPHGAILYVRGWSWAKYKDGNKFIRIFFGDQIMTPTLTGTYSGCSTGSDANGPYVNANDSGNFEITFTIPVRANGNYFVYARVGGTEGDQTSNYTTYQVTGSSVAPAINSVNHVDLSNNVSTGSLIRVAGSSFGANQPGIIVKFDGMGQNVTKTGTYPGCEVMNSLIKADSNGQFEITFYTPDVPDGAHEVYAQVDSALSNKVIFNVNNYRTPVISIADYVGIYNSGPKGSMLFVEGSGFVPSYTGISVKFNSVTMNVEDGLKYSGDWVFGSTVTSDGDGNFQVKFMVPDNTADGTYEVKAFAGLSSSTEVQIYTVKNQNTAEIDVYDIIGDMRSGLAGGEIICRGVYFTPATGNIKLKFDTIELALIDTTTYFNDYVFPPDYKIVKTDFDGKFEVKFNAPQLPDGLYPVTAFINDQTASNTVIYRIGEGLVNPALAISDSAMPYNEGPANEVVRIDGVGFPAGGAGIKIYLGPDEMNLTLPSGYAGGASIVDDKLITADSTGCFSVCFTVPLKTPMSYTLRASNGVISSPTYSYSIQSVSTFYTSSNSNFSTNDDAFHRNALMYLKVVSTDLNFNSITTAKFSVECAYHTGGAKHIVSNINLANNGDFTYTGLFDWSAYANVHNGVWQIKFDIRDAAGRIYNPTKVINITGTNVATQSSIVSVNSNLSTSDAGFGRTINIYYKIQSPHVEPSFVTAATAKLYCAANWYGAGGTHYYPLSDLTNNFDGTYNGSCNLNALSPLCHYGMWILNLKVQDTYPQIYEAAKEIFMFSSNSSLRAIISDNPYFGESYDIRNDGKRSDTANFTPYPIFNSDGTVYIVFNAAPPGAASKVNYSSVVNNTYKLQLSEYNGFTTGNYGTGSSVPAEKRGRPRTVSTNDFTLANNGNGLFTAEINLSSAGVTSVRRSWDTYFRVVMTVRDTANVTASITTGAHQIDDTNSQPVNYVNLNKTSPGGISPAAPDYFKLMICSFEKLALTAYIKCHNLIELARKPHFDEKIIAGLESNLIAAPPSIYFNDDEMRTDISLLSTPAGRELYFKKKVNNALVNCDNNNQITEPGAGGKTAPEKPLSGVSSPVANVSPNSGAASGTASDPPATAAGCECAHCAAAPHDNSKSPGGLSPANKDFFSAALGRLLTPAAANASSYGGKYEVVHRIRNWILAGGYMFTMCYATETIDRTLACDAAGNLASYDFTFAFKDFDPTKDDPSSTNAIDANDGTMTLVDQSATGDRYKRPLAVTQNHQSSFPSFSGSTTAFKKKFVKEFTGPKNSPVHILAQISDTVVKYIGAEYGEGWFTFLGGHDPRLVSTYRLILDNIMIGSLSNNNPPTATSISYGVIDWNNTDNGYETEERDYTATMLYGHAQPLYGEIATSYPGDMSSEVALDSIPFCFEDATNDTIASLYAADAHTPRHEGASGPRTYQDHTEGSSRFVLVPIVSNYYSNGAPAYTQTQNVSNSPKYIYRIVGRDKVRVKRYALFYLSGNTANPDADPLYNEVGALRYGEVRAKFVGYLK